MTQLIHEQKPSNTPSVELRAGTVFVPCAICRSPVDLAVVTDENHAPICSKHFTTEWPPLS
jgi:hypothetical protein